MEISPVCIGTWSITARAAPFEHLCQALQLTNQTIISRAQLPRLLAKVNGTVLAELVFQRFGLVLTTQQQAWFAADGKELRGSIKAGNKRGEVCVSLLAHATETIVGQTYYNGNKESERPAVAQLLVNTGMQNQKITLDALHLIPLTISSIHRDGGTYLVGLKANQQRCIGIGLAAARSNHPAMSAWINPSVDMDALTIAAMPVSI